VATLEIRDLSSEVIQNVYQAIEIEGQKIAKEAQLEVAFLPLDVSSKPALTDKGIQNTIKKVSQQLGYSTMPMQSGAGHDAQEMATLTRTGMIFIPSKGGISHSPKEFSSANDMAKGANVLLHTLLLLDKE
jgi:N-carbamoyl-L-amino-acid hydrolase